MTSKNWNAFAQVEGKGREDLIKFLGAAYDVLIAAPQVRTSEGVCISEEGLVAFDHLLEALGREGHFGN